MTLLRKEREEGRKKIKIWGNFGIMSFMDGTFPVEDSKFC